MDSPAGFLHYLTVVSDDLIFLHSGHLPRCRARIDKRYDGYFQLQLITRGTVDVFYDNRKFRLSGSWLWTAFPGPRTRLQPLPGGSWNHRYAAFKGPMVSRWQAAGLFFKEPQRCPPGKAKNFARQFDLLLDLLRRGGPWSHERAAHLIEGFLLDLAIHSRRREHHEPWLETVVAELDSPENLWPDYRLVARKAGLSLRTLRDRFRAKMGLPIHVYVMERRIAEARRLLGSTEEPLKEIAERLGYQDVYFFSRQFKQIQGLPPAAFRKSRLVS